MHYRRWRRHGSPRIVKVKGPPRRCGIAGCSSPRKARGWCEVHYKRWENHGDPLHLEKPHAHQGECSVEGCRRDRRRREWCHKHYMRWWTHGDPEHTELTSYQTECEHCGVEVVAVPSQPGRFCSRSCWGAWLAEHGPRRDVECEWCGDVFSVVRAKARFCSPNCCGAWRNEYGPRGKQHPNWRGGYGHYYGPSWKKAQRAVRERDQVCQGCGIAPDEHERALDVHHLVPFREFGLESHAEANRLENLVALCWTCHPKWEHNGPQYQEAV